jgi:two-component system, NtrC family, response regulator HydG
MFESLFEGPQAPPLAVGAADKAGPTALVRRLLGHTPSLLRLTAPLALAARHDVPILIRGQRGTGRTYLGQVIHECSSRREQRFVEVACAELSATGLERDLFGHGRLNENPDRGPDGSAWSAAGGTLVLEDVEALSATQQAHLLRILEVAEYDQADSMNSSSMLPRILTVSNHLEEATCFGQFRRELCDRLQGVTFYLPPLSERLEDIGPLAAAMAADCCRQFGKDLLSIAAETVATLQAYPWPGNLRQLHTVIQQAVLASVGTVLLPDHLPLSIRGGPGGTTGTRSPARTSRGGSVDVESERVLLQKTLDHCGNNRTRAARALGISRVTLYKKMKRHRLLTPRTSPVA